MVTAKQQSYTQLKILSDANKAGPWNLRLSACEFSSSFKSGVVNRDLWLKPVQGTQGSEKGGGVWDQTRNEHFKLKVLIACNPTLVSYSTMENYTCHITLWEPPSRPPRPRSETGLRV